MSPPGADSLLVVGTGQLGGRVARLWRQRYPQGRIIGETESAKRHDRLSDAGVIPRLGGTSDESVAHVLVAVPTSAAEYASLLEHALNCWSGAGSLLLVSSTGVYAEEQGGTCTATSALADSPRARRLLTFENRALRAGGMVVRMAGLYERGRGPHIVYLRQGVVAARADGWLNLIHYDDAATLCLQALVSGSAGNIYLGCDDAPQQRQHVAEAAHAAGLSDPLTGNAQRCQFTAQDGPLGRRCDNRATRQSLGWQPVYPSFAAWLKTVGEGSSTDP